jgi:integrase
VPLNSDLEKYLKELRKVTGNTGHVLPRITSWRRGEAARELRKFLLGLGLPQIRFHDLRAIFATQLLRNGIPPIKVMKICGWNDLKTMQYYVRLAGVDIEGATDCLNLLNTEAAVLRFPVLGNG